EGKLKQQLAAARPRWPAPVLFVLVAQPVLAAARENARTAAKSMRLFLLRRRCVLLSVFFRRSTKPIRPSDVSAQRFPSLSFSKQPPQLVQRREILPQVSER